MTETIRYSLIGKEDINFGTGTFAVTLSNGQVVTLSQVDIGTILANPTLSSGGGFPRFGLTGGLLSVKDFGAVGNGTTDDTSAFQSAITAVDDGGTVVIPMPSVRYLISSSLSITKNIAIIGLGTTATTPTNRIRIHQSASTPLFSINPSSNGKVICLENLSLTGGTNLIDIIGPSGGYISRDSRFHNLEFGSWTNKAINITAGVIGTTWSSINVEGTGAYGLYAAGNDVLGSSVWYNARFVSTTTAAAYIEQTVDGALQPNITFIAPIIESNAGTGMDIRGSDVLMINPHFESNGSTTGGADLDLRGLSSTYCRVVLHGGLFSTVSAAQSNRRILFSDNLSMLWCYNTNFRSADIFDGNSKVTATRLGFVNCIQLPTINNYTGGHYAQFGDTGINIDGYIKYTDANGTVLHGMGNVP